MMRKEFLVMIIIWVCFSAYGQKKLPGDLTLFEIDSKPITVEEFVYLYKKNNQGRKDEFTREKIDEYIDLLINFKLKVREAESRGIDSSPEFVKELNGYKEELKKPFTAEVDELKKLTEQAYKRLGQEVKASHILINVGPEAAPADTLDAFNKAIAIRSSAVQGEDFEKLAREFSEDPSAKMNGGNLGYFSALQMVFPFEEAAYHMNVGEVSNPIRTQFGYHLIKVFDKRPSSGEVEVSHILIRGSDDNARKLIDEVYGQLQHSGNWDTLCVKYSQDPGTKDNGGRLRPFGMGALASAPQFEEAAFSLKEAGSISKPVQTSYGWHIIRLERKIPLPPYVELKASLEKKVARDERMAISKALAEERRRRKFNYQETPLLKNKLEKLADSSLIKGNWKPDKTGVNESDELFTVEGRPVLIKNFASYVVNHQTSSKMTPIDYLQNLYDQFVDEKLASLEDVKLQQANPEYRKMVNEYREGILLFNIMEVEVWNKASADSVGQREYYDGHPEKYNAGLRIEARIFSTEDKEFSDLIKTKMEKGDTLSRDDTRQFKSIVNFRSYEKGDNKVIDQISWSIGLHQLETDGKYYLVEISKLVPPGRKAFEEVRASVISDYQDSLEKEWISELKKKYPVKVNAKGRKKAIEQLVPKEKS